jgi:RNA polymerase sigma-70 factor (ECF subfamily)
MTAGDPAPPIELLRRAQAGDQAALGRLLATVEGAVLRRVREVLGKDDPFVHDVAWDARTLGAQALGKCCATDDRQVYAWFRSIARNAALRHLRGTAEVDANARADREPGTLPALPRGLRDELLKALRAAYERLPQPSRRILLLRGAQNHSWGDIGAAMAITPDAARMRYSRVRLRVRADIVRLVLARAAERGDDTEALQHFLATWIAANLPSG